MIHHLAAGLGSVGPTERLHAALLALPLGLTPVALVPLGQVPDEAAHAMRAQSLWQGELIAHRERVAAGNNEVWPRGGVIAAVRCRAGRRSGSAGRRC